MNFLLIINIGESASVSLECITLESKQSLKKDFTRNNTVLFLLTILCSF